MSNSWVYLNTDGSVRIDEGFAAAGDRCFQNVLIQTDSIEAIKAIMEDDTGIPNSTIIRIIHQTLKKLEQWKIQHVPKGSNLIVDSLAKIVCGV
ncbi:hypothetical protein Gotri_015291 [Gossypium trilobum]|uniref:RNase H type-1 domain-containing protein n=1 Tax=Gossypium trilobum TaxID=34281 RepID=A0A7J9DZQ3_9ROSI|nr:hypothetical protein [Gossypium trilobum]